MLIRLGGKAAPVDAVDLALECHERIRSFLALARRIPEARDATPETIAEAAARVRRYFVEALPLHARDEEDSFLPRLLGRDPEVDRALETMAREHEEHEAPLSALVAACEALSRDPGRLAEVAPSLAAAARELDAHFAKHLAAEEAVILPAMRRLLDAGADAEIVREIRARRGVVEDPARTAPAGHGHATGGHPH
jgi:iron-sulfur cluster repair protein YtfE (RIC family)